MPIENTKKSIQATDVDTKPRTPQRELSKEESIIEACVELQEAMVSHIRIQEEEELIKLKRQAAHKRLSMARDTVHALNLY